MAVLAIRRAYSEVSTSLVRFSLKSQTAGPGANPIWKVAEILDIRNTSRTGAPQEKRRKWINHKICILQSLCTENQTWVSPRTRMMIYSNKSDQRWKSTVIIIWDRRKRSSGRHILIKVLKTTKYNFLESFKNSIEILKSTFTRMFVKKSEFRLTSKKTFCGGSYRNIALSLKMTWWVALLSRKLKMRFWPSTRSRHISILWSIWAKMTREFMSMGQTGTLFRQKSRLLQKRRFRSSTATQISINKIAKPSGMELLRSASNHSLRLSFGQTRKSIFSNYQSSDWTIGTSAKPNSTTKTQTMTKNKHSSQTTNPAPYQSKVLWDRIWSKTIWTATTNRCYHWLTRNKSVTKNSDKPRK